MRREGKRKDKRREGNNIFILGREGLGALDPNSSFFCTLFTRITDILIVCICTEHTNTVVV
jgi:hypothetical protein